MQALRSLRPLLRRPPQPWHRQAAALAAKRPEFPEQLDLNNAKILRVVEKKVAERANLLKSVNESSGHNDIARSKQLKELEPLKEAWDDWSQTLQLLNETTSLLHDADPSMRALAADEHAELTTKLQAYLTHTFPALLLSSSSPTAHLHALLELKAGVGGSEAALFLAELLRMYTRFAGARRWAAHVASANKTDEGGVKDAVLEVRSAGAYEWLRWESGVHRVQRVPATEASGRVHTSTVAVVVLPLVEEAEPSPADDLFKMEDVKIEVMRARGAGGQHVNKTESAVRLTHIPTGITVSMQDERSQHQNKRRAFQILRARLMDIRLTQEMAQRRDARRSLVRTADRSEKIRTYNYAQDRVTDHRLGLSLMNLESVMEGNGLETFVEAMRERHAEETLEMMLEEP
ncbi:release factor [Gloeophyllum trabeum ATCC 11539]|uniref:Release factor n=1 Tax=Gloeophyllum trabeum (strain ATCC 11539 / FP-39264 / Madison 617) TaxID=670483 RepID=S7PW69_GLOTA|nr:release factor [Gloeophyllum trabeum ATCC 11539]EPQ51562.1 release factor [Gloeophyllum trabeum ATCC 11539]